MIALNAMHHIPITCISCMTLIAAHHTVTVIFSVFNLVYCVASSSTKYAIVHHLFIIKIFRILDSPADRFSPAMLGQHCSVAMEIVLCQQMKIIIIIFVQSKTSVLIAFQVPQLGHKNAAMHFGIASENICTIWSVVRTCGQQYAKMAHNV